MRQQGLRINRGEVCERFGRAHIFALKSQSIRPLLPPARCVETR